MEDTDTSAVVNPHWTESDEIGKKVSAATMSDMARRPQPIDRDATADAVDAARRRMAAAWALWLIVGAGRRPPRGVAAALVATASGRADLYRIVRAMPANAPVQRPRILDAATRLNRTAGNAEFREMIETLRVAHDLAATAHARTTTNNARGVAMARYFRAL